MSSTSVSVVICSHNREAHLEPLLENEELRSANEILLVTDDPVELSLNEIEVKTLENEEGGLPAARNTGLRAANSDLIAFIDDDFWPVEGWFSALVETFETDRSVVAVGGPSILVAPGRDLKMTSEGTVAFTPLWEVIDHSYQWIPPEPEDVPTLPGSNMCLRRKTIDDFQFDEKLRGNYYREETDFIQQVRKSNPEARVIYHPDVWGYHIRTYCGGCSSHDYDYWSAYNHAYVLRKHLGYSATVYLLGHILNPFSEYMSNPPTLFDGTTDSKISLIRGYLDGFRASDK
jgi:glycosyltransferase involved in cell wall biosynthesis